MMSIAPPENKDSIKDLLKNGFRVYGKNNQVIAVVGTLAHAQLITEALKKEVAPSETEPENPNAQPIPVEEINCPAHEEF